MRPGVIVPALLLLVSVVGPLQAQELRGRVIDANNGAPVGMAGVFLLDSERNPVRRAATDMEGLYLIETPGVGEYYLYVQRLGYFENESPLIAVADDVQYGLDIEMRPEPFRLDPIAVTVRNEELEHFLTLKLGVHPNSVFGYRVIQGIRLQEAKLKAVDNTDLLRWLYIPVSHGIEVCVGAMVEHRRPIPWGLLAEDGERAPPAGARRCGSLYLDDYRWQNEHIEEIDMDQIGVVVVLGGSVHLYTRDFEWTMRPGG